jgi:predicted amidohydrolase
MRRDYGPMATGTALIPAPYPYRCRFRCGDTCNLACFDQAVETIDRATSGTPAAIIVEFVLGAGGIIPVPANWAHALRELCTERGALLIADEALTGIGRTGRWFAFEHTGVVPDLVVTSKALGGGIPLSAVLAPARLAREALANGFLQAASHQGDPFQCAVALANLDVIEHEGLLQRATALGELLGRRLHELVQCFEIVGQVRGVGLLWGIEIVRDRESRAEAPELAAAVSVEAMERGLIVGGLRPSVREANVLRLAPPLVVSESEIDEAVAILHSALAAVQAGAAANTAGSARPPNVTAADRLPIAARPRESLVAAVVEMAVRPGDVAENLVSIRRLLAATRDAGAQLVCFPELCLSGYMLARERYTQPVLEACERALAEIAAWVEGTDSVVVLGSPRLHRGRLHNSVVLIRGGSAPIVYDKTHLDGRERAVFDPGSSLVVDNGVGLACCYDIAFPELSRTLVLRGASLLVFPMAWETRREFVLRRVHPARAVENIAYVACANQTGASGEFMFAGGSCIIDPLGATVCAVEPGAQWALATLDLGHVQQLRTDDDQIYPLLRDRRRDLY